MSADLKHGTTSTGLPTPATAELVHKLDPSQVLLTDWRTGSADVHHVTAVLPDDHPIYRGRHGGLDPMLVVEAYRQSILLLGHTAYGTPLGDHQAWMQFGAAFDPAGLATGPGPTTVELRMAASDIVRRAGRPAAATMRAQITAGGRAVASATTQFTNQSLAVYSRLRGAYADVERAMAHAIPLPPPLSSARAARAGFRDVVLSATDSATRHQLRVDPTHPGLFDHPVDHAPGMLLLEAIRQSSFAHLADAQADLVALQCTFSRYCELDAPCWMQSTRLPDAGNGDARFSVTAVQHGRCILTAAVDLRPRPAA